MRVLVGLVDQLYLAGPHLAWGSRGYEALESLYNRFLAFKAELPADDSLNLDPVVVR